MSSETCSTDTDTDLQFYKITITTVHHRIAHRNLISSSQYSSSFNLIIKKILLHPHYCKESVFVETFNTGISTIHTAFPSEESESSVALLIT